MKLKKILKGFDFEEAKKMLNGKGNDEIRFRAWEKYGKKRIYLNYMSKVNWNTQGYLEYIDGKWIVSDMKFSYMEEDYENFIKKEINK